MKTTIGFWIDHRKAVIVTVSNKREKTKVIESMVEKQPGRFAGVRSTTRFEAQKVQADDSSERKFTGQSNTCYDEVVLAVGEAESILLFGPGEAKGEMKKHLEEKKLGRRIEAVETEDTMTDRQIAAKVRDYFQN